MEERILEVERREGIGKEAAKKLRKEGKVPAVIYGGDLPPRTLSISRDTITSILHHGEINTLFKLKIKGVQKTRYAMIHDVQVHPITHEVIHVDLIRVMLDKPVSVTVPVELVGVSPGVKAGGVLDFAMRELDIECLPKQVPESIEVDISPLHIGDNIKVEDLTLPEGIKALEEPHAVIVRVAPPKAAVAEVEEVEEEAEPEVISKGKREEEEGESA